MQYPDMSQDSETRVSKETMDMACTVIRHAMLANVHVWVHDVMPPLSPCAKSSRNFNVSKVQHSFNKLSLVLSK